MRLIDADALLSDIEQSIVITAKVGVPSSEIRGANKVIYCIKTASAVDAVPVARCKDCKHNPQLDAKHKNMVWCRKFRVYVNETGFCSYGERRKDATD